MECTIAVFGDFALVATDDETKTFPISDNIVMAVTGESGDTVQESVTLIFPRFFRV